VAGKEVANRSFATGVWTNLHGYYFLLHDLLGLAPPAHLLLEEVDVVSHAYDPRVASAYLGSQDPIQTVAAL